MSSLSVARTAINYKIIAVSVNNLKIFLFIYLYEVFLLDVFNLPCKNKEGSHHCNQQQSSHNECDLQHSDHH